MPASMFGESACTDLRSSGRCVRQRSLALSLSLSVCICGVGGFTTSVCSSSVPVAFPGHSKLTGFVQAAVHALFNTLAQLLGDVPCYRDNVALLFTPRYVGTSGSKGTPK